MMNKLKFVLSFIMFTLSLSLNATIDSGKCGDNVTYRLEDDGTLYIEGSGEMTSYTNKMQIPWYFKCSQILKVKISKGITSICSHAFEACSDLTSITIPNSVTSIGEGAFYICSSLTSIEVDSSNPDYSAVNNILFNKEKTELLCCAGGKTGAYTIPNSVTSIGKLAFGACSGLTSITIPNSVTSIGEYAFLGCSDLTSITIPNSVTSIGEMAFNGCI